jgi:hypothetical protein
MLEGPHLKRTGLGGCWRVEVLPPNSLLLLAFAAAQALLSAACSSSNVTFLLF